MASASSPSTESGHCIISMHFLITFSSTCGYAVFIIWGHGLFYRIWYPQAETSHLQQWQSSGAFQASLYFSQRDNSNWACGEESSGESPSNWIWTSYLCGSDDQKLCLWPPPFSGAFNKHLLFCRTTNMDVTPRCQKIWMRQRLCINMKLSNCFSCHWHFYSLN